MPPTTAPLEGTSLADDIYSPPAAQASEALEGAGRASGKSALKLLGLAGVSLVSSIALFAANAPAMGIFGYLAAVGSAFVGLVLGIRSLWQLGLSSWPAGRGFTLAVIFAVISNAVLSIGGAALALIATMGFSRGRQLRRFGRVLLPKVGNGGAWANVPLQITVDEASRQGLAAQWRENGRTEHASVAAFARLTLDLMALGAPPTLVAAANRDALDEIRHTELCFSLARALDGKSESPAPFPAASRARTLPSTRTLALATLAVDSLVDGALHEGVSARVIAKLARRCEEPAITAVLKEIAADEGRHAAHGWDVVEWCLSEGGSPVASALRGAALALPHTMHSALPEPAEHGAWERYGIHGRPLEAEQFAETRADLQRRLNRLLAETQAQAA